MQISARKSANDPIRTDRERRRVIAVATRRVRSGTSAFRISTARLLRRDGIVVNIIRVLRVYREANLQVRKRVRRRVALGRGNPRGRNPNE